MYRGRIDANTDFYISWYFFNIIISLFLHLLYTLHMG